MPTKIPHDKTHQHNSRSPIFSQGHKGVARGCDAANVSQLFLDAEGIAASPLLAPGDHRTVLQGGVPCLLDNEN